MIAPIFKKLAKEMEGKAVFVKVDTNAMYELSSRYMVYGVCQPSNFFNSVVLGRGTITTIYTNYCWKIGI